MEGLPACHTLQPCLTGSNGSFFLLDGGGEIHYRETRYLHGFLYVAEGLPLDLPLVDVYDNPSNRQAAQAPDKGDEDPSRQALQLRKGCQPHKELHIAVQKQGCI